MKTKLSISFGIFVVFASFALAEVYSAGADVVVTFDPPSLPHGSKALDAYNQNGIYFCGTIEKSFAHTDCGFTNRPNNGTAHLSVTRANTYFDMGGSTFNVKQIDISEYSTVFAYPARPSFTGHKLDGSTVTASFSTDGVIDGAGPLADFQTFTFPASFTDLTRVDFDSASLPLAIDNLIVTSVSSSRVTLQTEGSPLPYGVPLPSGYGSLTFDVGTTVTNRVGSIVDGGEGIRHLCQGWTGTGSIPASGSDSVVSATVTVDSTLTWNWQTQYRLVTQADGEGAVSVAGGWYNDGSNVVLRAIPASSHRLAGWQGDTNGCAIGENLIIVPMTQARTVVAAFGPLCDQYTGNLVLWNRLGSESEVQNSMVGSNGLGGVCSFVAGPFGNGLEVNAQNQFGATFPLDAFPRNAGCLEFWARVSYPVGALPWGHRVSLIGFSDTNNTVYPMIHFNGNDGCGDGGLCAGLWGIGSVGTGMYGYNWTYTSAVQGACITNWHHYALVWSLAGVADMTTPVRRLAVYVDGSLNSGYWGVTNDPYTPVVLPENGRLGLLYLQNLTSGRAAIDNVKIWDFAKTDFSDRFDESAGGISYNLTVAAARGAADPDNGVHSYVRGTTLSACVPSPVTDGTTRYVCTGATVAGNAFARVSPTNVSLTVTNNATLTWIWQTEHELAAAVSGNGSVVGGGWYTAGNRVFLTASPETGYQFTGWSDGELSASRAVVVPEGGATYTANFSPLPRGVLRFQKAAYSVAENATVIKLTVERTEGSYGVATIDCSAASGSATSGSDFAFEATTLAWGDGVSGTRSVFVEMMDDEVYEGNETFDVLLSGATGATLGTPETATVTIIDNEGAPVSIPSFSASLDFGEVATNATALRTVELRNDGNQPLVVTNVWVPVGFSVTQKVFDVQAGEAVTLAVCFTPTDLISYAGSLTLGCNATTGTTALVLSGVGVVPPAAAGTRTITGLTAVIMVDVPKGADVLGVEDGLTPGLIPVWISDGGTWDAVNSKVKWFFNQPGQVRDRALQYRVGGSGNVVTGLVNFGSVDRTVTGDTVFVAGNDPGLLHPADDNGDWRITLSEVSASVSRWKNGSDGQKTPSVVRGITLYLQGEWYTYDPQVSAAAKRWIPVITPSASGIRIPVSSMGLLSELSAGALRSVQTTNVTVTVTPESGTSAWGLEESLPAGVQVAGISNDGTWDAANRRIKWAFFDGNARTLSYRLDGSAGMNVTVAGTVSFDGSEGAVTGDSAVAIPLSFLTWAAQRGLSGTQQAMFGAMNAEHGQPNGLVYAFQSNLQPGDLLITLRWLNGKLVIETPKQHASTLPFVDVQLISATELKDAEWGLVLTPAADQSGVPDHRCLWQPSIVPDKAFFRLKAVPK